MKLPVDLTTRMWATTDRLAKVSSMIFMSTAMGNFMTCLGSMDDKDILMNVTALGILVITVIANVCVQIIQMRRFLSGRKMFAQEILAAASMLLLLVMVCKGQKWVMAETSSPQFVIAHSVTCTASGFVCLLTALILVQAEIRILVKYRTLNVTASKYGRSSTWIVLAQSIGVAVGIIAPAFRCYTAIKFKCSEDGKRSFKDEFKIEAYWTQRLVEWKESSLP
ncbi:UNVERIFIED_CONTAM: hypothetical protein Sradi_4061000 [Sesamum radiatum]|uniref:Uncharacterized protein n=1 Tax=Sesamum radiatum TaxID=300843 RepID=A0AAW2PNP8_SESRA